MPTAEHFVRHRYLYRSALRLAFSRPPHLSFHVMWDTIPLIGVVTVGLGVSRRTTSGGNGLVPAAAAGVVVARVVAEPEMMDAAQRASQEGQAAGQAWPEQ